MLAAQSLTICLRLGFCGARSGMTHWLDPGGQRSSGYPVFSPYFLAFLLSLVGDVLKTLLKCVMNRIVFSFPFSRYIRPWFNHIYIVRFAFEQKAGTLFTLHLCPSLPQQSSVASSFSSSFEITLSSVLFLLQTLLHLLSLGF